MVVGGLAGCAIAYYGLLPLIFWFKTPANTAQKSRGRPPVERFVKPEGANQKPPPAMAEPSREPSREPSPLSMPEQKDEKAAPPEKPSEPAASEGATKETAPKTEAEPPRSPAGAAQ